MIQKCKKCKNTFHEPELGDFQLVVNQICEHCLDNKINIKKDLDAIIKQVNEQVNEEVLHRMREKEKRRSFL